MMERDKASACIQADAISSGVSRFFNTKGSHTTWQTACAAGNYALHSGYSRIASGRSSLALVGGSDAFSKTAFIGFARVGALSPDVCRPFDHNRKGLLLGEGSGMLILETVERGDSSKRQNLRRSAGVRFLVATHFTSLSPIPKLMEPCWRWAVRCSRLASRPRISTTLAPTGNWNQV